LDILAQSDQEKVISETTNLGMNTLKTMQGGDSVCDMLLSQNIARLRDSDLRILYGNIINNIRVVGGGISAFAAEYSLYLRSMVSDHCGYNMGEIKSTIHTIFS